MVGDLKCILDVKLRINGLILLYAISPHSKSNLILLINPITKLKFPGGSHVIVLKNYMSTSNNLFYSLI